MHLLIQPWQFFLMLFSGWVNRQQEEVIAFQNAQIQVLLDLQGRRRILLSETQRCLLAAKGKRIGRKALSELTTICTPDTILRWHRELFARKWDYSANRRRPVGRPRIRDEVVQLIVQFARENSTWGYTRIRGALDNLGYQVCDSTIANVLKEKGIEPAPQRPTTWKTFLEATGPGLFAVDFTNMEIWTKQGLVTCYILVVMQIQTRRIQIAGFSPNPDSAWVTQVGRNLTDCESGFLNEATHLLMDRDSKLLPLRHFLENGSDISPVPLPPRSPNLNAHLFDEGNQQFDLSLKGSFITAQGNALGFTPGVPQPEGLPHKNAPIDTGSYEVALQATPELLHTPGDARGFYE